MKLKAKDIKFIPRYIETINITYLYYVTLHVYRQNKKYRVRSFNNVIGSSVCSKMIDEEYSTISEVNKRLNFLRKLYKNDL